MLVLDVASELVKGVKRLPRKIFGTRNDRMLKVYRRKTGPSNERESEIRGDFDERLARQVAQERVSDAPEDEREGLLRKMGARADWAVLMCLPITDARRLLGVEESVER